MFSSSLDAHLTRALARIERLTLTQVFWIGVLINLAAFGQLVVSNIYTNHTFPNVLLQDFPSYRVMEGRWAQDVLYLVLGKGATHYLGMFLAIPIQVCNGLLFARLLERQDNWSRLITIALISTYPFVLDYFSFVGDNLTFVLPTTFAMAALLITDTSIKALLAGGALVTISLSFYQPAIATLASAMVARTFCRIVDTRGDCRAVARQVLRHILIAGLGCVMYLALLRAIEATSPLTHAQEHFARRLYTNTPSEAIAQFPLIFADFFERIGNEPNFVFGCLRVLPALVVIGAALFALRRAFERTTTQRGRRATLVASAALWLVLAPIAAYLSFVISKNSYWHSGRFVAPVVLVIATACLVFSQSRVRLRAALAAGVCLMTLNYIVTDVRIVQFVVMRSQWDMAFANRIVARMERLIRNDQCGRYRVVMIGQPLLPVRSVPGPRTAYVSMEETSFAPYRQVELFNYVMGRDCFVMATADDVKVALETATTRESWPDADSVYLARERLIVVIIEPYVEGRTIVTAAP
ncbi:glucosyltransferase domain-containing protein [Uliginosibacterium sp. sgz301328]|uniref:glucosyltransferase domain-containing protein n=1 Tax=Uliginosibacterium sp. sgz301328 TaxID=3243764 RepID=UPI00359EDEC7